MEHSRDYTRIFKRHSIRKPVSIIATDGNNLPSHMLMENLSGGGVLVHTSAKVPLGARIEMIVELPFPQKWFGVEQVQVLVRGKVIRRDGPLKVAVRFEDSEMIGKMPGF
ncbi:MAG: PilZ domain-containing protein [Desulfobacteraceae bacterium]|nr:PilZ domain-containing protein [Desulfobacteraceae bacterium]